MCSGTVQAVVGSSHHLCADLSDPPIVPVQGVHYRISKEVSPESLVFLRALSEVLVLFYSGDQPAAPVLNYTHLFHPEWNFKCEMERCAEGGYLFIKQFFSFLPRQQATVKYSSSTPCFTCTVRANLPKLQGK